MTKTVHMTEWYGEGERGGHSPFPWSFDAVFLAYLTPGSTFHFLLQVPLKKKKLIV